MRRRPIQKGQSEGFGDPPVAQVTARGRQARQLVQPLDLAFDLIELIEELPGLSHRSA